MMAFSKSRISAQSSERHWFYFESICSWKSRRILRSATSCGALAIAAMVPFESFRSKLKAALIKGELRTSDATRKSLTGRKPWDEVMIFKALVLQALYNLSDDQAEYQLSRSPLVHAVSRFGTGGYGSRRQTLWLYREALAKAGAVEELFDLFDGLLKDKGYLARGGQIIDATIVSAPKQHNSREDNETLKEGETPEDWK